MSFLLDHEAEKLLETAERIGRDLRALVDAGESGRINRPLIQAMAAAGLVTHLFPANGQVRATDLCLIRQGMARSCIEAETAFAMQGLGAYPIFQAGTDEQKAKWIPPIAAGRAVPAFALTEPGAGSDAAHLSLAAEPDKDGFRLSGTKRYISNAPEADLYTVFARTGPDKGAGGVTAFVVPGDSLGLSGGSLEMANAHPIGWLEFDGVVADHSHVLGTIGEGFKVAMRTLDLFRPSVGAFAVGMAESALAMAMIHARDREAFGQPLTGFQAISHQLADMATRIDAARLLVYQAADAHDRDDRVLLTGMAAAAKLFATETAQYVVDSAIQIHGARGLERSHPLAHLYEEVRATRIYEGTSEIQRNVISRELLSGRWVR
ncbi:MAG: acyl-CoA dehydrogenase family protein [Acidimicrobiia bacterium]